MDLNALYKLTHGLYVLGAKDGNRFVGSLVDAVMQAANKPVAISLSCGNNSYTKKCIDETGEFSLSVLSKKANPFIVANFGFQSSKNVDKWDNVDYLEKDGFPYIKGAMATFKAKVIKTFPLESNTLYVAEVTHCDYDKENNDGPLTYLDYRSYFKTDVMNSFMEYKNKGTK